MARRRGATPAPHLAWRVRLFAGAAILVVVGMYADLEWLIWGAIVLLAVAFALRFTPVDEATEDDTDDLGGVESDEDSETNTP